MKLTQMIEKFAKQGMLNGVARAELLQAAEETEQEMAELQEELSGKDGELAENRKTAAVERAILEGGGKNVIPHFQKIQRLFDSLRAKDFLCPFL